MSTIAASSSNTLKVALIQRAVAQDLDSNLDALALSIKAAAQQGAQLIVLEELHNSVYFCQTENPAFFDLAESIPGKSTAFFGKLARQHGVVIVTSLFERRAAGLYHNTAVVIDADGDIAGYYRKMHIPDDPGFYEKFYFAPGDLGFIPVTTAVGRLGVLVCWDQWYPEAARAMTLAGADLLIYPTAIGWDPTDAAEEQQRQLDAWTTIQRSHAVANGLHVLSCNRCGHEASPDTAAAGIHFWGHSFVCGPQGEILAQANTESSLLIADIPLQRTETVRRIWPFLRDRRIDAYNGLSARFLDDTPAQ